MKINRLLGLFLAFCMVLSVVAFVPAGKLFITANAALNYSGGTRNSAVFIIDPGHGGSDPGACSLGRQEAADVLDLSIRVAKLIDGSGSTCALTRTTDVTQSLATKVSIANSGSFTYFLSIHRNAGGGKGVETYYYSGLSSTSGGAKLATSVQNSVIGTGLWTNRGVKSANFYVVKNTSMDAALVEMGFIDTANDNAIFANNIDTHAKAIANGLLAMIGKSVTGGSSSGKYQSCMDAPSGSCVSNGAASATISLTQKGSGDTTPIRGWTVHSSGVSKVEYNIDGGSYTALTSSLRSDVQAAIGGYSDYSNCGFDGTLNYGKLSGGAHKMVIRATTKANTTYTVANVTLNISDPIKPTISNIQISNRSKDGYRVSCTVSDNAGISGVRFPTWTAGGGQDDLIWHQGTVSGSTAYYDVKVSEHGGSYDEYATHIYATDISGNESSAAAPIVNLSTDNTAPVISGATISNVTSFGFDVKCNVSDNIGVTKIQFPTWSESGGQDDLKWLDVTASNGVAAIHVNTKDFGYQTGLFHVHLYAWDTWGNEAKVELTVTVPAPAYPTDADYIKVEKINGSQYESCSQIWTTGTFTAQYWGVLVLQPDTEGYKVIAKHESGQAKSVAAGANNIVVAVHEDSFPSINSFANVAVGDVVTMEGVSVADGVVLSGAHIRLAAKFVLKDNSAYKLDTKHVTLNTRSLTVSSVSDEFKCTVKVLDTAGAVVPSTAVVGTGFVVQQVNGAGTVIASAVVVVPGDLTGDGITTAADGINAKLALKSKVSLTEAANRAVDLNEDGTLSSTDYVEMLLLCKASQ